MVIFFNKEPNGPFSLNFNPYNYIVVRIWAAGRNIDHPIIENGLPNYFTINSRDHLLEHWSIIVLVKEKANPKSFKYCVYHKINSGVQFMYPDTLENLQNVIFTGVDGYEQKDPVIYFSKMKQFTENIEFDKELTLFEINQLVSKIDSVENFMNQTSQDFVSNFYYSFHFFLLCGDPHTLI